MIADLRLALRMLVKDRTFAVTALLTLAVTIGANAAIFSIVRSVLLKPLPVPGSERIALIYNSYPNAGAPKAQCGVPDYFDRLGGTDVFEEQALYRRQGLTLGDASGAERLTVLRATPSFFRLVQARPVHGRIFSEAEGEIGHDHVVLLSHALWTKKFGADAGAVGKTMRLNGQPYEIAGVLPADFKFLWNDIELYVPAAFTPEEKSDDSRHSNNWNMIGRLKPEATIARAQQEIDAINARNDERFPQFRQILKDAGFHTTVVNLQDDVVSEVRPVLYLLWGGVLFVLLIGAVNIANLVVVRSSARTREMATRHAIGASLARLGRQWLTETVVLAVLGAAFGIVLGWWALRSMGALRVDELPRGFEIALDPVTVAVVFGLSLLVGLGIGLVPVARLYRLNLNNALREEGRSGTSGRGTNLLRRALATAQVAIAFLLLVGAGLMLASFRAVLHLDPGFSPDHVWTGAISLPQAKYEKDEAIVAFTDRALERLQQVPGVDRAGLTTSVPFSGDFSSSVIVAEGYVMKPGESLISPMNATVSPGYFEAMTIPIVRGRYFSASDTAQAVPKAIIVDERLAAKFWPGQNPLGRRMYRPENPKDLLAVGPDTKFVTVVGVVKNVQVWDPGEATPMVGAYYYPMTQAPERSMEIVARSTRESDTITNDVRAAIREIDPELAVYGVETMSDRIDSSLIGRRVPMMIAIAFGFVALFLAAIGIYGVLAYGVTQRRREIGIRMALGGTAARVFGLVVGEGVKIVGVGLVIGAVGAWFAGRAMTSLLFEVKPTDPFVLGAVIGLLALVALVATIVPARRAAAVNPAEALE